jgi:hypothetical protein
MVKQNVIKNMKKIIYVLCGLILFSCHNGILTSELEENIQKDINIELEKRASENNIKMEISSFDLIHKDGKEYSGILKTLEDGIGYTYQVDVTVDGDNYLWYIKE